MPLLSKRTPTKKRRSQTRLGRTHEAEAPALQLTFARVHTDWKDKLDRLPSVVLVGMLCYALFYLFTDDRFFVFEATVAGHSRLSAQEIYSRANIEGQSIFFLNRGEIASQIEQLPDVKKAIVTCQLPAGVYINVIEREPVYNWRVGEQTYWLDEDGVVMEPKGEPLDAVTFLDVDGATPTPGSRVQSEILQAADELQEWLPEERVFQWSQAHGLSFWHRDGYPIYLGQLDNLQEKLTALRAMTEKFSNQDTIPEFVDMRFSGSPYFR